MNGLREREREREEGHSGEENNKESHAGEWVITNVHINIGEKVH